MLDNIWNCNIFLYIILYHAAVKDEFSEMAFKAA